MQMTVLECYRGGQRSSDEISAAASFFSKEILSEPQMAWHFHHFVRATVRRATKLFELQLEKRAEKSNEMLS